MAPIAPYSGATSIVVTIIYPRRKDRNLCRLTLAVPDNIQSNTRHGEGPQQPERIHITQDVDLATHEQQHRNGNAPRQCPRTPRRPAEHVATHDKFGED